MTTRREKNIRNDGGNRGSLLEFNIEPFVHGTIRGN
jgi:hypothetical protein